MTGQSIFFPFAHLSKEGLAVPCMCSDKKLPVILQPVPAGTEAGLEKVLTVGRVSPAGAAAPQPSLFLPGFPGVQLWEKPSRFCVTLVLILPWAGFCGWGWFTCSWAPACRKVVEFSFVSGFVSLNLHQICKGRQFRFWTASRHKVSKNLRTVMSKWQVPPHGQCTSLQQPSPAEAQLAPAVHQSVWIQLRVPKQAFFSVIHCRVTPATFHPLGISSGWRKHKIPPGMVAVLPQLYSRISSPIQFRYKWLTADKTLLRNMDCLCVCAAFGFKSCLIKSWKITFSSFMFSVHTRAQDSCFYTSE